MRPTEYTAFQEREKPRKKFIPTWDKKSNGYFQCVTKNVVITLEKTRASWRATVKIGDSAPIVRFSTISKESALYAAWHNPYSARARDHYEIPHVLDWGDFDYGLNLIEPEPEPKKSAGKQAKIRTKVVYAPQWCGLANQEERQGNENPLEKFFSGLNDIFDVRSEDIPDELARPFAATLTDVEPEYRLGTAKLRLWAAEVFRRYK